jgi:hypothetical protein
MEGDLPPIASALLAPMAPRVVDEGPSHGLGGHRLEVGLPLPVHAALIDEPEKRLVHERGGLERVVRPPAPQVGVGQIAQLLVDQGEELVGRLPAAATDRPEELGWIGGGRHSSHGKQERPSPQEEQEGAPEPRRHVSLRVVEATRASDHEPKARLSRGLRRAQGVRRRPER